MIRTNASQVSIGDVVLDDKGHAMEVLHIDHQQDGRILFREQNIFRYGNRLLAAPSDMVEIVNRCEVCRQRTLAHTGECMAPTCQNLSNVPDDPEAQLEWVKAARAFKAAALKMSDLWSDLDDRAQSVETPDEYPWNESFDDGPLHRILGWLNEEKLFAIEQRAYIMGDCPNCGKGQLLRGLPPTEVTLAHKGADAGVDCQLIAACTDCQVSIIE